MRRAVGLRRHERNSLADGTRSDERAGQDRQGADAPADLVASDRVTGISAAALARSRVLGEPRWSPDGAAPGLARRLRRSGRPRRRGPADGGGPDVTVTAEVPVTGVGAYGGGGYCWVDDDTLVYAAADGRLLAVRVDGGRVRVLSPRRAVRLRPRSSPDGTRVAFVIERDDACDVARGRRSTAARGPGACRTPTTPGTRRGRPTAARWPGTSGICPNMPWDGSRIMAVAVDDPTRSRRSSPVVTTWRSANRGSRRWATQLAFVAELDGWMNVWTVARRRRRAARAVLAEAARARRAGVGSGPAVVRVVARRHARSRSCRNEDGFGRLVVVAPVDASTRSVHRALEGLAHRARLGRARASPASAPVGRTRAAAHRARSRRRGRATRGRRGAPARARRRRPRRTRRRSRGPAPTARRCTGCCGCRADTARAPATLPPLLVDVHGGPTDQATRRLEAADPLVRRRAAGRCCSPNYRGSTGYGRDYRQALDHAWGDVDVGDTVAGIRAARARGRVDPVARRGDGRQRRRLHRAARRRARTAPWCARGGEPVRRHRPLRPRRHHAPVRVALPRPARRHAARARRPLPRRAHRSPTRATITVPVLVLQGADDKVVPPAQAQLLVDSMRAAGGDRRAPRVRGRGPRLLARRPPSSTPSNASTRSSRDGWSDDDSPNRRRW